MSSGIQRVLAVSFALGAAVALAPPATAAVAKLDVTVEVTNKAKYTASLCGFDWLGGRCDYAVRSGKTSKFLVHPRSAEDLVWARVVPKPGGFDEQSTVPQGNRACFETGGTAKDPTVTPVDCV